jgi:predicted regulator of Ras-like GTPase activity (Roadblock/LC7/MglB family)
MMVETNEMELMEQIENIIDETMESFVAIKGISIGSSNATNIFTKLKPELKDFSEIELVASSTSFQFIARNLYSYVIDNNLESTYVTVNNYVLLLLIVKEVAAAIILDRALAELESIKQHTEKIKQAIQKIAVFIETSEYLKEDPMVAIKRAIPTAKMIAIVSKEGMPIKIEGNEVHEAMMGSMISALANLTGVILKKPMDYCVMQGKSGHLMVVQFDSERILAISLPPNEETKIGEYLARIKEIIRNNQKK